MSISGFLGLMFVIVFFGLIIFFSTTTERLPSLTLREITAFSRLRKAIGMSVEAGKRLHFSIGRGNIISPQSAVGFLSLSVLRRMIRSAFVSDHAPVTTTGEGGLAILAQDTQRSAALHLGEPFDPSLGQLTGLTPFSYAAGVVSLLNDEKAGTNVLIGHYGSEAALIADAGERTGGLTLGGTDSIPAQAILYAGVQEPLIGEEVFASGAYLEDGGWHSASLHAQDVVRWALITIIIGGAFLKLLGVL